MQKMQVQVETYSGYGGIEVPRRFRLDGREIEAVDTLDQWYGRHDRYFKVRGADGNLYILRFDELRTEWKLVMFQRGEWQTLPESPQPNSQLGRH
jgi:hypothetical protein